jgi:SSS family solute:Na+ symporter
LCTAAIGTIGRQLFPGLPAGFVLPHVIQAKMQPLVGGIVVAVLLGAAMSSGTGVLISLAGCFSRDFYNKVLHPDRELDDLKYANAVTRGVIVVMLLLGLLIAFRASNLLSTMILLNYPYMGSMLVPLLGGVLWRRANRQGATAAMAVGGAIGIAAFVAGIPGRFQGFMNYNLGLLIAWSAAALVFVVVSLLTAKGAREMVPEVSEKGCGPS